MTTKNETAKWTAALEAAHTAGLAAVAATTPTPLVVVQRANPFDDSSAIVRQYAPIPDGVCGFGWVEFRPERGGESRRFVNWVLKQYADTRERINEWDKAKRARLWGNSFSHDSYTQSYHLNIWDFNQSYEKKTAYASAFARSLQTAGIEGLTVRGTGRLD